MSTEVSSVLLLNMHKSLTNYSCFFYELPIDFFLEMEYIIFMR